MSELITSDTVKKDIWSLSDQFQRMHSDLDFNREAMFAFQIMSGNAYLMSVAQGNRESVRFAVLNVAAIGLTLNPAQKLAYLVPRGGKVCLDISYLGLVKLATDSGSITSVVADVVKEKDTFEYNGPYSLPTHKAEYFKDRGATVGVYCSAKLHDGTILTATPMSIDEIYAIRDRTEAWKSFKSGKAKSCPWFTDESEMIKKTMIKRASKLWPKTERLAQAVEVINEHEGIDFQKEQEVKKIEKAEPSDIKEKFVEFQGAYDELKALYEAHTAAMNFDERTDFLESALGVLNFTDLRRSTIEFIKKGIEHMKELKAPTPPSIPEVKKEDGKLSADDIYARIKSQTGMP